MWSAARSAKISMILCMPERVSGGDAKFQGFCDGWNKWGDRYDRTLKVRSFESTKVGNFQSQLTISSLGQNHLTTDTFFVRQTRKISL